MGEYAKHNGEQIKIGTCEDMYYLRADQLDEVQPVANSLDPWTERRALRFRFPWPDEDHIEPGRFQDYDRGLAVNVPVPDGVAHRSLYLHHDKGYRVEIACPESGLIPESVDVSRDRVAGRVEIVQTKITENGQVLVCRCACGALYRLEDWSDVEPIVEALDSYAQVQKAGEPKPEKTFQEQVADRIREMYLTEPATV